MVIMYRYIMYLLSFMLGLIDYYRSYKLVKLLTFFSINKGISGLNPFNKDVDSQCVFYGMGALRGTC